MVLKTLKQDRSAAYRYVARTQNGKSNCSERSNTTARDIAQPSLRASWQRSSLDSDSEATATEDSLWEFLKKCVDLLFSIVEVRRDSEGVHSRSHDNSLLLKSPGNFRRLVYLERHYPTASSLFLRRGYHLHSLSNAVEQTLVESFNPGESLLKWI